MITDYTSYKEYFQAIAIGPQGLKDMKSFYHGGVNELQQAITSDLEYPCLWLEDPAISMRGIGQDNEMITLTGAFVVLGYCEPDDFEKRSELKNTTFLLATDVLSKMKEDYTERIFRYNPDSFQMDPIDSILIDNAVGWRIEFRIDNPFAICYDPSKFKS